MWFGTAEGLNRFDGYSFRVYKPDFFDSTSISDTWITALYEDNSGNIWIGTFGGGLNVYNVSKDKFFRFSNNPDNPNSLADNVIYAIVQDSLFNVWIGTNYGLSRFNSIDSSFTNYFTNHRNNKTLNSDAINTLFLDNNGTLWVGTNGKGLYRYNRKTDDFTVFKYDKQNANSISSNIIWSIQSDPTNFEELWIATYNGINKFNTREEKFFPKYIEQNGNRIANNQFRTFLIDNNGDYWLGTRENGLWHYNPETNTYNHFKKNRTDVYGLSENQILCLYQDRSGLIWIGTRGGELNKVITSDFQHLYHKPNTANSIPNSTVWAVIEAQDGNVWIGTNSGLTQYVPNTNEFIHFKNDPNNNNSLSDNYVYSIVEDLKGIIWVGTSEGGLNRFDPATKTFSSYQHDPANPNSLSHNYVRSIIEDYDGTFWLGTRGGGVNHFNPETGIFTRYLHSSDDTTSLSHDRINVVYRDSDSTIWVGTSGGGLNRFNRNKKNFTHFSPIKNNHESINNSYVLSICEGKNHTLWIGTYNGGLNRLDLKTNTFKHYTENNGLANDVVYGICIDDTGNLWLSTNRGLSKFNPDTEQFRTYDTAEGIQGLEFNTGSYHRGKSGKLYFGGTNGLSIFQPKKLIQSTISQQVTFTDLKVHNQPVKPSSVGLLKKPIFLTDTLVLTYKQNDITLSYSAMLFQSVHKIQYKYKMEGFDENWISNGSLHIAKYTNLPPGNYTFKIMASNRDGVWSNKVRSLYISVIPPFWRKTWFYLLLFSLLFLLIFLFVREREKGLIRAKTILEDKVSERTKEIQKQKEEIESQRDYVLEQRNEIEQQRNSLANLAWELQEKTEEIESQKDILSIQNKEITDSIVYAQRIQRAVLPSTKFLGSIFPNFFIIYKPKSIVSGDFFWATKVKELIIFCVTDCTGHGVPGAFMSMMGIAFLNEIVRKEEVTDAAKVLNELRIHVISSMEETEPGFVQLDGMDIGLCVLNTQTLKLQYAGANIPCWISTAEPPAEMVDCKVSIINGLVELKPDRMPIARFEKMKPFSMVDYQLKKNDTIYLASDGYADQFGGKDEKKFQKQRLMELIYQVSNLPQIEQKMFLETTFEEWKGNRNQIDDVTILSIKV